MANSRVARRPRAPHRWVLVLAVLTAGCSSPSEVVSDGAREGTRTYHTSVHSAARLDIAAPSDLLSQSEAVVAVKPVLEEEFLKEIDGVEFYGQPVQVLESFKGPIERGTRTRLIRTVYGPTDEAREEAEREALVRGETARFEPAEDGLRFDRDAIYVVGLIQTNGFYGVEAWAVNDKLQSYIPFNARRDEPYANARVSAAGETSGQLHRQWQGLEYAEVRRRLERAAS